MRAQQNAQQHVENLNRAILILDGFGHSGDYDRLVTVLGQVIEDLQNAAQAIEELSDERWAMQSVGANSSEKPTAIEPKRIQADCPVVDGYGAKKAA
jgi:hypothetical protein